MEKYTIILWSSPEELNVEFEQVFDKAYRTILRALDLPNGCRPKYLSGKQQKMEEVNLQKAVFEETLKKATSKEGDYVFSELGYRLAFYSHINTIDSFKFSLNIGNQKRINTFVVDIAPSFCLQDPLNAKVILDFFVDEVSIFNPFFACIKCNSLSKGNLISDGHPSSIHWANYWSPEIAASVDKEKLSSIMKAFPNAKIGEGFLILQNTALSTDIQICHQEEELLYNLLLL